MQDYRKLEAWQKAHTLTLRTYATVATFPRAETFGLGSQMRRAAVSVPANIAEGCYRGEKSQLQSLRIALGSAGELEYYFILARDLKLLSDRDSKDLLLDASNVKAVIMGLWKCVKASLERTAKR